MVADEINTGALLSGLLYFVTIVVVVPLVIVLMLVMVRRILIGPIVKRDHRRGFEVSVKDDAERD